MTPAEELRIAAEYIRRHADGVTPRPWKSEATRAHGHRVGTADGSNWVAWTGEHGEDNSARDADWIALMHPGVGLALAKWLESAAEDAEQIGPDPHALAVARQFLGGEA